MVPSAKNIILLIGLLASVWVVFIYLAIKG